MVSPGPFHVQRAGLEAFLLAEIGTEPSGMPLTVLSMLARCGEDAWEKAGHLATLREPVAANELARIILQSQTRTGGIAEATAIATRLVPLLPSQADTSNSAGKLKPGASGIGWAGAALLCLVFGAPLVLNTVVQRTVLKDRDTGSLSATTKLEKQTHALIEEQPAAAPSGLQEAGSEGRVARP